MKKNKMMRAASVLLILVLLTTCTISGTFAKYTTSGTATDTARVAKWGVKVFTLTDTTGFARSYETSDEKGSGIVVESNDYVVAPGTKSEEVAGNLIFGITGTPEVATNITVNFTGTDIYWKDYHPIKFTLWVMDNNAEINVDDVGEDSAGWKAAIEGQTLAELTAAINTTYGSFTQLAGETLDALYMITWEWAFDVDGAGTNDAADTKLGNIAAKYGANEDDDYCTYLNYGVEITVTQVD